MSDEVIEAIVITSLVLNIILLFLLLIIMYHLNKERKRLIAMVGQVSLAMNV